MQDGRLLVREERYRSTMNFLQQHGWKAAYFAYAASVLLTPGILSWLQLLVVFFCNRYISDMVVRASMPVMLLYSCALLLAFVR